MTRLTKTLALMMAVAACPALAQTPPPTATVESPDKTLSVTVTTNGEGRPVYSVSRKGKPLVNPSELGFILTDAPKLHRNLSMSEVGRRAINENWDQPWGEWKTVNNRFNELKLRFKEGTALARVFDVTFRVFNDGVGFRYEIAQQPNLKALNIGEELTQFDIAQPATAWWTTALESNREEYLYNETPIAEMGTSMTPLTLKTADGTHIAIHEAALVNYSGMNITKVKGGLLKADLYEGNGGPKVSVALTADKPFTTPWRTLLIADNASKLYEANRIILNLNEPNKLGDVSWVKPRKYVGVWWGMHLDTQSWNAGPKHGATTEYTKKMIDFAAANGFSGVLVEGWNKGWDGDWFANGQDFSFTESYPDFDIKAVTDYGKTKGVALIGHHETSANGAHYEGQLEAAMALYKKIGVDTVKTGYVSDAGGFRTLRPDGSVGFGWHEGQGAVNHHLKVVQMAAKYQVAVNPHEPVKDTGLRRTYPNWVSREGQRGMEYNAWSVPKNPPSYDATVVYTRMLGGPFDFTPGILSLMGRGDTPIPSTLARQLAYYVVLYSPIQMAADLPENYAKHPDAFQFIKDVAVDWSDTRALNGEVGRYATIARKERNGKNWFLGSLTNEEGRTLQVPLSFLDKGKRYRAEIYRDGDGADFKTNPFAFAVDKKTVTSSDTLSITLAPGGGQAIRFVAL